MDYFEQNFLNVSSKIQEQNKTFLIKGIPKEYAGLWSPNNEVKLWCIPRTSAEVLRSLALVRKSKSILEIGTSSGYSALWLGMAARENFGKVFTIEFAKPKVEMAKANIANALLDEVIEVLQGNAFDILNNWNKLVDFVFFDADKPNHLKYLKLIEPFLEKRAVIVADNAITHSEYMIDYLNYVKTNSAYYSYLLNIDFGLMISVKL